MSTHSHQPRNGRLEQQSPSDRSSSRKGDLAVNSGPVEIKNGTSAANVITLSHTTLEVLIQREISLSRPAKERKSRKLQCSKSRNLFLTIKSNDLLKPYHRSTARLFTIKINSLPKHSADSPLFTASPKALTCTSAGVIYSW